MHDGPVAVPMFITQLPATPPAPCPFPNSSSSARCPVSSPTSGTTRLHQSYFASASASHLRVASAVGVERASERGRSADASKQKEVGTNYWRPSLGNKGIATCKNATSIAIGHFIYYFE